jgi:hypothetical protein
VNLKKELTLAAIKTNKFLIETDILIDFLTGNHSRHNSYLVRLMQTGICFTSVLNASELYFYARTKNDKNKLDCLFHTINVLGIHSRYCLNVSDVSAHFNNYRDTLFYILANQNRLTIITQYPEKYSGLECKVMHPSHALSSK